MLSLGKLKGTDDDVGAGDYREMHGGGRANNNRSFLWWLTGAAVVVAIAIWACVAALFVETGKLRDEVNSLRGQPPAQPTMNCDVAVIGAGPGVRRCL